MTEIEADRIERIELMLKALLNEKGMAIPMTKARRAHRNRTIALRAAERLRGSCTST